MKFLIITMVIFLIIFGCMGRADDLGEAMNESMEGTMEYSKEQLEGLPEMEEGDDEAHSQADCATVTPDCESCLAKEGCGWCKETNSCHIGDESGPYENSCNRWATTLEQCDVRDEKDSCREFITCPECLSGTGCKWCIQGSVCAAEESDNECFGGWMMESYQCVYASR